MNLKGLYKMSRSQHVVTAEIVVGRIIRSWLPQGSAETQYGERALDKLLEEGWIIVSQSEINQNCSMSAGVQTFVLQKP